MPKRERRFAAIGMLALLVAFTCSSLVLGDAVLRRPFDHGEYFASLSSLIHDTDFIPITVHGALDYIPGLIAIAAFGKANYAYATRLIYVLLEFGSAITLFLILRRMLGATITLVLASFVIPFLVGYRDFSLLLLLLTYLIAEDAQSHRRQYLALLCLGVVGVFNFYFSTNRGIAGTVAIGSALLISSFSDRKYLIAVISFLVTLVVISLIHPILDLANYANNLLFLAQISYQWSYGFELEPILLTLHLGALLLLTIMLVATRLRKNGLNNRNLSKIALFGCLSLFYFQIATYRADLIHITMGLMIVLINISYWYSIAPATKVRFHESEGTIFLLLIFLSMLTLWYWAPFGVVVACILFGAFHLPGTNGRALVRAALSLALGWLLVSDLIKIDANFATGGYDWVGQSVTNRTNAIAATTPTNWVVGELKKRNARCVFDLSNNGVINAVANLPACTRFSYIIYADKRYEGELIGKLSESNPAVIVYSTSLPYYRIDGRSMAVRFPNLDTYIRERYPHEICKRGYCIRYRAAADV